MYTFTIEMRIGEKIKRLRGENALSQKELATLLRQKPGFENYAYQQLGHIEQGRRKQIFGAEVKALASILHVSTDYLLDDTKDWPPSNSDRLPEKPSEAIYKETDRPRRAEFMLLPLYGEIVGGPPEKAEGNLEGHYEVLAHLWGKDRYVLRVRGDSMYPDIRENDLILVENLINDSTPIDNFHNKICTVLYHGESTLKKINITKEGIELRPINPHYPAILVKKHEDFSVQGVVLKLVERDL